MMRVLVVCSFKEGKEENATPFVREQVDALRRHGVECEFFLVRGKGISGYLGNMKALNRQIRTFRPDVIHAHYGLCGLLANLQRKVPVVTTYHGSDINDPKVLRYSKMSIHFSAWNIFVSRKTLDIARPEGCYSLLPCGVDLTELQLTERNEARHRLRLDEKKRYILFAGAFDNPVKNVSLAKKAVALLHQNDVELIELKGYSRDEVTLLMCAANTLLMTSVAEGSPQVIKEAMACGCPIVSVDVGDVLERVKGVDGCYVSQTPEPQELSELLDKAMAFGERTKGREKVIADGMDNEQITNELVKIYYSIIK